MTRGAALALLVACAGAARAAAPAWEVPGGDPRRGERLVREVGCGGCHTIPGVRGAHGNVGPPLARIADRTFIAGVLRNEPQDLVHWLRHPQQVVPGNGMPDTGLSEQQARDVAAFLYTLH